MRRAILLAILLCCGMAPSGLAQDQAPSHVDTEFDPLVLYGPSARYDILRDGTPVGSHHIDFTRDGDTLVVESKSEIKIQVLFVTAYNFSYSARSRWRDGKLLTLEAMTDDDGKRSAVRVVPAEKGLIAQGPTSETPTMPTQPLSEHWWQRFIAGHEQLNTITGVVNRIDVEPLGTAYVPMAAGVEPAARFRIDGDIQLETWYDDAGRWLGMRFMAQDGSSIEYRCRVCRAGDGALAGDSP